MTVTLHSSRAAQARGRVWALAPPDSDDQTPRLVAHVGGTLLGGAFDADGGMYLADATRGLLYIAPDDIGVPGRVRIAAALAPSALENAADEASLDEREIRYANDLAIDFVTGIVYFTDSSRIAPVVGSDRLGLTMVVRCKL
jgi:hypothetical protein